MKSCHLRRAAVALTTSVFLTLMAANSAQACKGSEVLLRDDFTEEDPAWDFDSNLAEVGGGVLKIKSEPGRIYNAMYQGQNFPGADTCIDIIFPAGAKPSADSEIKGGLGLWTGKAWHFVAIAIDGTARVEGLQDRKWVNPVPTRKFAGIKTEPNAVNQLRVTWKAPPAGNSAVAPDPTVTIYINDKQFIKYKTPPNVDRSIGLYTDSNGAVFQFKNLVVTAY